MRQATRLMLLTYETHVSRSEAMTIDGLNGINFDSIDCEQISQCTLIGNTIQGGADGVGVYNLASGASFSGE